MYGDQQSTSRTRTEPIYAVGGTAVAKLPMYGLTAQLRTDRAHNKPAYAADAALLAKHSLLV
jgi:hypothetical protein